MEIVPGSGTIPLSIEKAVIDMKEGETKTITLSALSPEDQLTLTHIGALVIIPIATGLGTLIYLNKRKHSVN